MKLIDRAERLATYGKDDSHSEEELRTESCVQFEQKLTLVSGRGPLIRAADPALILRHES